MEIESLITRQAQEYTNKLFGDKDPELKQIVEMNLVLDPNDPNDEAVKQKVLDKMKREHIRNYEFLKDMNFLIHDISGNLIPIKYDVNINNGFQQFDKRNENI